MLVRPPNGRVTAKERDQGSSRPLLACSSESRTGPSRGGLVTATEPAGETVAALTALRIEGPLSRSRIHRGRRNRERAVAGGDAACVHVLIGGERVMDQALTDRGLAESETRLRHACAAYDAPATAAGIL